VTPKRVAQCPLLGAHATPQIEAAGHNFDFDRYDAAAWDDKTLKTRLFIRSDFYVTPAEKATMTGRYIEPERGF
jgi:hypothetical protein